MTSNRPLLACAALSVLPLLAAGCGGGGGGAVTSGVLPNQSSQSSSCAPYSNASNFNGTAVPAGDTIWFTSVMQLGAITSPVTIYMTNSVITVVSNGTTYTIGTPNSAITIDPSQSEPTLTYNASTNTWVETSRRTRREMIFSVRSSGRSRSSYPAVRLR